MKHHSLSLQHRGVEHRHPWLPSCVCGWVGVARRRRHGAEIEYAGHLQQQHRTISANTMPRPVTPFHELPEGLR